MAEDPKGGKPAGRKKSGASPGASDDDLKLWQKVAKTAKPLAKRSARKPPVDPPEKASDRTEYPGPAPKQAKTKAATPRRAPTVEKPKALPSLSPGASADVDRRTADRLKRGKLPIEGRLDLHGMTQAEAQRAVAGFIASGQAAGRRCLLIITGKGSGREGGVLRQSLPGWLNEPVNRSRLVAFTAAQPQHGGHGAMYLLLKRARD